MFTIPSLFSLVLKLSHSSIWSNAKKVSEGLTEILDPESKGQKEDTFFNKFYKGRTLYQDILDIVEKIGFSAYIFEIEGRLKSENFRENKFLVETMVEHFYKLLMDSSNINGSIYVGLSKSYVKNYSNRPYLF